METLTQIAAVFGTIVVAGTTVTSLAFWLFKLFGEKWLSNKFAERLEAFKHDQQKEIEHLRFEINKLLDRTTKLHQREFEVLPRAWALLAKSYHAVKSVTSSLQTYPDFTRMAKPQMDEFLANCPLQDWQKTELSSASDQNRYYSNAIAWHYISLGNAACKKSAVFLLRNGIFMPPALKDKFQQVEDLVWKALVEYEINKQHDFKPMLREALKTFSQDGEPLMKELEREVQQRLWSSDSGQLQSTEHSLTTR